MENYMFVTLTTPESGVVRLSNKDKCSYLETDINHVFRLWRLKLSRRGITFPYFAVREYNKKRSCVHIHMIIRTSHVDFNVLHETWQSVTGARWIKVIKCYGTFKSMMNYVLKYMTKAPVGARRFWYSQDWVFPGFVNVARDYFVLTGENAPHNWLLKIGAFKERYQKYFLTLIGRLSNQMKGGVITLRTLGKWYLDGQEQIWKEMKKVHVRQELLGSMIAYHSKKLDVKIKAALVEQDDYLGYLLALSQGVKSISHYGNFSTLNATGSIIEISVKGRRYGYNETQNFARCEI